jgi:hypothetical protein
VTRSPSSLSSISYVEFELRSSSARNALCAQTGPPASQSREVAGPSRSVVLWSRAGAGSRSPFCVQHYGLPWVERTPVPD